MKDIELPPLPGLLEKAIVHFAQACLYSDAESRRASAEQLKNEVQAYARAAVEAAQAQRVPDGWKLVPVEPTREMIIGALESPSIDWIGHYDLPQSIYRAMLASTPAPAQQEPVNAVAYLDIGAGGYMDLGTDMSDEALSLLPKGRHMLVIAGTYGVDGYTAAQHQEPPPAGAQADDGERRHEREPQGEGAQAPRRRVLLRGFS